MRKILKYLRVEEWLTSKVTLLMGVLLFFAYLNKTVFIKVIYESIAYLLFVSMFLAVSYVANDFSDLEVDRKAGKKKIIAKMPKWEIWLSLALMLLVGNAPIILLSSKKNICAVLILITYLLGLAYSTLGIRFKEKGIWGLIECSFAQRSMPLLLICCIEEVDGILILYLMFWILISFLDGLRYILIHQVIDIENDLKSGVNTYVVGKRKNFRKVIISFFISEIILLGVVLYPLWYLNTIIVSSVIVIYILFEFCIYMVLNIYAKKDWFVSFDSVPLEAFLNIIYPIVIGICMIKNIGIGMVFYCVVFLVICFKPLMVKVNLANIYIKSKIR